MVCFHVSVRFGIHIMEIRGRKIFFFFKTKNADEPAIRTQKVLLFLSQIESCRKIITLTHLILLYSGAADSDRPTQYFRIYFM